VLSPKYADKVKLEVVVGTSEETQARWQAFSKEDNHGLVAHRADGTIAATIPGHQFGAKEIVEKIDALLK
jgi:hypothetical protein